MGIGDIIEVTDGRGHIFTCRIIDNHPKHTLVDIIGRVRVEQCWPFNLTVAVAPTKHIDRMEWLIEKLVEVGVNQFVPLLCQRSERREIKRERLEKIAISAMKQSLKATLPAIDEMAPLAEFLSTVSHSSMKFVGYCDEAIPRQLLSQIVEPKSDIVLMIGPEGDFSEEEIHQIMNAGFTPITLGNNRLRTETAAIVAATTIHVINQL